MGHAQQRPGLAARKPNAVLEILPAPMHVRMQTVQRYGRPQLEPGLHPVIGITRRNPELSVRRRERENPLWRRLLRENQSDPAAIRAGFAVSSVMNLQNNVG